jgi:tryptophan-rich sensory protein
MGIKFVALIVSLGAFWDGFTTFRGVADLFDLVTVSKVNPFQFSFALVVTMVVFGFVIATHLIWSFTSDDLVTLVLKIAWVLCFVVDFYTSLVGTRYYVFNDDIDTPAKAMGLLLVTFLVSASSILLSRLLLAKDIRGRPYLY